MSRRFLLTVLAAVLAGAGLVVVAGPAQADAGHNGSMNDLVSPSAGLLHVRGWVYDHDNPSAPVRLHLYVGGTFSDPNAEFIDLGVTDVARQDVQDVFPEAGPTTGFDRTVEVVRYGSQPIFLYALNAAGDGALGPAVLVDGTTVVINNPSPYGELLSATSPAPGQVTVTGSAIQNDTTEKTRVAVTTNGTYAGTLVADQTGSGFYEDYPVIFNGTVPSPGGAVNVCVTAINQGVGRDKLIDCRQVQVQVQVEPLPPPVATPPPAEQPRITLRLKAIKKKSKLRIDVGPDLDPSNYRFSVQKRAGKKWRTVRRTQTLGARDLAVINLPRGRYRVVVPEQHGMAGARATARLKR